MPWSNPQIGAQYVVHVLVAVGAIVIGLRQHQPRRPLLGTGSHPARVGARRGVLVHRRGAGQGRLPVPCGWSLPGRQRGVDGLFATPSGRSLTAGAIALIVANLGYSIDLFAALHDPGGGLDVGWLAFFALAGAAALHPSMTEVDQPAPPHVADGSGPRV